MSEACDICGAAIQVGEGYVVRVDVFADPRTAPIDSDSLPGGDPAAAMASLIEQMKHMSADELQDGVHRRFEYRLCPKCQREYLSNPLGMPRRIQVGRN